MGPQSILFVTLRIRWTILQQFLTSGANRDPNSAISESAICSGMPPEVQCDTSVGVPVGRWYGSSCAARGPLFTPHPALACMSRKVEEMKTRTRFSTDGIGHSLTVLLAAGSARIYLPVPPERECVSANSGWYWGRNGPPRNAGSQRRPRSHRPPAPDRRLPRALRLDRPRRINWVGSSIRNGIGMMFFTPDPRTLKSLFPVFSAPSFRNSRPYCHRGPHPNPLPCRRWHGRGALTFHRLRASATHERSVVNSLSTIYRSNAAPPLRSTFCMCRRRLSRRRHVPSAVPAGSGGGRRHGGMEVCASSVLLGPTHASRGSMGNVATRGASEPPAHVAVIGRRSPVIPKDSDRRRTRPARVFMGSGQVTTRFAGLPGAAGGIVSGARHGGG